MYYIYVLERSPLHSHMRVHAYIYMYWISENQVPLEPDLDFPPMPNRNRYYKSLNHPNLNLNPNHFPHMPDRNVALSLSLSLKSSCSASRALALSCARALSLALSQSTVSATAGYPSAVPKLNQTKPNQTKLNLNSFGDSGSSEGGA